MISIIKLHGIYQFGSQTEDMPVFDMMLLKTKHYMIGLIINLEPRSWGCGDDSKAVYIFVVIDFVWDIKLETWYLFHVW